MRQEWSPEELLANWTLVDGDWDLVADKSGTTRLGFSHLLKFFELEGRFPDVLEAVPPAAVEYVAELVKVPATEFAQYMLVGRTAWCARTGAKRSSTTRAGSSASRTSCAFWSRCGTLHGAARATSRAPRAGVTRRTTCPATSRPLAPCTTPRSGSR
ncbi:DUF4158 domain-containing protein [Streptomyces sp. NPDC051954]|uniref:DUF4158 domain-containing protein n=1 Tax=unclassified Streptomyces TaxID=2593676 RepID=UPI00341FDFD0